MGNHGLQNFCGLGCHVLLNLWLGVSRAAEFLWPGSSHIAEFLWLGLSHAAEFVWSKSSHGAKFQWLGLSHVAEFLWSESLLAAEFLWPGPSHAADKFCDTDKLFALLFLCDVHIVCLVRAIISFCIFSRNNGLRNCFCIV